MKTSTIDYAKLYGQFPQLQEGTVYADWTGAALPPKHLIDLHHERLLNTHLGNPHSHHSSSTRAARLVEEARSAVLGFVNASADEYDVIFTPNASGAIGLMQHFLWQGGQLLAAADNHNSVNGLREMARRDGALTGYAPLNPDLTLNEEALGHMLRYHKARGKRLFAMPGKSNYSGIVHSLKWVNFAQEHGWHVLLDAAALVANHGLDLSEHKPDFVPLSVYKICGFPTGVGALIIKKTAFEALHKRWFSGGTILLVSVMADFFAHEGPTHARFEDGTVNFGMIPAVIDGLDWVKTLGNRSAHATGIATSLHEGLAELRHKRNSVRIHSPRGVDLVTFSIVRDDQIVNAWEVEQAADGLGIQMRTGCFCNPGVNETVMGYTLDEFRKVYHAASRESDFTLESLRAHSGGKPIGAIRASFGYANQPSDAERIVSFVREYLTRL